MSAANMPFQPLALAIGLHNGRKHADGLPMWMHNQRVLTLLLARAPSSDRADVQAAMLHNVLSETQVTEGLLLDLGVDRDAIAIIVLITEQPGETLTERIQRIIRGENSGALRVMLAVLAETLNANRNYRAVDYATMVELYRPALAKLQAALHNG